MAHINFSFTQAFAIRCDVCDERFVGGTPDEDKATYAWVERHAKWHESGVKTRPPANIILPSFDVKDLGKK